MSISGIIYLLYSYFIHLFQSLLEQIDLLKVVKLDREDMLEAMADKADLGMLARKVSHDRFESACDDLSKGLETALGKLNLQVISGFLLPITDAATSGPVLKWTS